MINSPRLKPALRLVAAALLAGNMNAASEQLSLDPTSVQHYDARVVAKEPFDRDNFVQGLEFDGDRLLVSSGLYGESSSRLTTGPRWHFAMNSTCLGNCLLRDTRVLVAAFIY